VAETTSKMIRVKWARSGIGFTRHQKTIVRSLGLTKLNQTVVRPDTPQVRGIVAAVPHLLQIVPEPPAPAWASIPEYTVYAPAAATESAESTATTPAEPAGDSVAVEDATEQHATLVESVASDAVAAGAEREEEPSSTESDPTLASGE